METLKLTVTQAKTLIIKLVTHRKRLLAHGLTRNEIGQRKSIEHITTMLALIPDLNTEKAAQILLNRIDQYKNYLATLNYSEKSRFAKRRTIISQLIAYATQHNTNFHLATRTHV